MTTTGSRSSGFSGSFGCLVTGLTTGAFCSLEASAANTVKMPSVLYRRITTRRVQGETRL
jgi:hypothetical protein